ncbi:MAG: hypothetical protein FWD89_03050 [Firmicutes bacterium]|nr:hypothetical protein [Bacillota bacterium]
MKTLGEMQKVVWKNKVDKGFNTTDVHKEFCYTAGELGEAITAYMKKKDDLGEELADVCIYLMGLAEMTGYSLEEEVIKKIEKNGKRKYIVDSEGRATKIEG